MNTGTVQIDTISTGTVTQSGKLYVQFRVTQDDLRFSGTATISETDLAEYRFSEIGKAISIFLQKKLGAPTIDTESKGNPVASQAVGTAPESESSAASEAPSAASTVDSSAESAAN